MSSSVSSLKSLLAAAVTVSALALAPAPASAASFDLGGEHLNQCWGPERVARVLKKMKYTGIEHYQQYSKGYVYMFAAQKPKRDGHVVVWHLYYDACERELIGKESQE